MTFQAVFFPPNDLNFLMFLISLYFSSNVQCIQKRNFFQVTFFQKKAFVPLNNKIVEVQTTASAGSVGVIQEKTWFWHTLFLQNKRETSKKNMQGNVFQLVCQKVTLVGNADRPSIAVKYLIINEMNPQITHAGREYIK